MAVEVISNKVLIQNNKYGWMICSYEMDGNYFNYTLKYYFEGGDAQLDDAYLKVGGTTVWSAGRVHNYSGNPGEPAKTITIHGGSAPVTGTQTITFGITKYQNYYQSGSFTVTGGGYPTGITATYNSSTWNSINITSSVSTYGSYTGTPSIEQIVVDSTATSSNWETKGRQARANNTTATSSTQSVTNSNSTPYSGGITIKGAMDFKVAAWVNTSAYNGGTLNNTVYHTPPAPLQSITYTQTQGATDVTIAATITGGTSTNNYGNTVTTYYRYSTNGGSSYTNWTSAGTGTAWTAKSVSFTVPYKANIIVQAKQTYQSKDSEVKSVSFTSTSGTAPSSLSATITASTWNSVTMNGSATYGNPSSISGRSLTVGVNNNSSTLSNRREKNTQNVGSVSDVVINNTSTTQDGGIDLKGMLPVYPFVWASNTVQSASNIGSVYYLPPSPGIGNYSDQGGGDYYITYTGIPANNVSDYVAADLTRTFRYKIDNGAWVYIDNAASKLLTDVSTQTISIPYQSTATVEAWHTYKGKDSEKTVFTILNDARQVHFYGSVNDATKEIKKFYCSIGGKTVKVTKLYASVGGVAKEVFEDV